MKGYNKTKGDNSPIIIGDRNRVNNSKKTYIYIVVAILIMVIAYVWYKNTRPVTGKVSTNLQLPITMGEKK